MEELEAAPAVDIAEAPAPEEAAPAVPTGPFDISPLSAAQVSEILKASKLDERLSLLARCLSIDVEDNLRQEIWLDMLLKVLMFCYDNEIKESKALAFLKVMSDLHAFSVESMCSKVVAYDQYKAGMLAATKSLPMVDRFSLEEVQTLTNYAITHYLDSIKLHQLVFTEEQTVRESAAELFLQTPAAPPPFGSAVDPEAAPAPAAPAEAAEEAEPAADEAAEAEVPPAAEEDEPAAEAPSDDVLTEAISATINSQVAAHQSQLAAEIAAKDQLLLDKLASLESKLK